MANGGNKMSKNTKTTLNDLNEYLFGTLDALSNEDLEGESLEREIKRAKQINEVGKTIVDNARVVLDAHKHKDEYGYGNRNTKLPGILAIDHEE